MDVHVSQEQDLIPIATDSVVALVTEFLKFSNLNFDEVSIYFVDTPTICEMHKQFFDDPTTTDCISFPMDSAEDEGYRVMGDVFVCPETAHSYVATDGGNVYKEITLYVVHGLLHLIGYDDIEDEDIMQMRNAEADFITYITEKQLWIHP